MKNFFVKITFVFRYSSASSGIVMFDQTFSWRFFDSRYILILEMVMSLLYYVLRVQWLSFLGIRQFIRYGWFQQIIDVGSILSVTIHVVMLTV